MAGKQTTTDTAAAEASVLSGLTPEVRALIEMQARMIDEMRASREQQPLAQAQAFAKINDPSNKVGPEISAFNPRGQKDHPMPELKCEIWAPWRSRPGDHGLDREEVELFNLLEPGEYTIELVDGTPHKVVVLPQRHSLSGALTRLTLSGALNDDGKGTPLFTQETKSLFPSMRLMLREMIGDKAEGVMTMKQEVKLVKDGKLTISAGE